jgi:ABC-type nitrate/sulfonate/bicarbonate transport system ATPase subunit
MTKYKPQKELQHFWEAEGITMILVTHDVEEAVYPGDRVVVMEPRPGRIWRIVPVPLERPRNRWTSNLCGSRRTSWANSALSMKWRKTFPPAKPLDQAATRRSTVISEGAPKRLGGPQ